MIAFSLCAKKLEVIDYIKTYTKSSTLYEDEYVDPSKVEYTFPEKKRNLIYIFLESVESSFVPEEEGGICSNNLIPELNEIAIIPVIYAFILRIFPVIVLYIRGKPRYKNNI